MIKKFNNKLYICIVAIFGMFFSFVSEVYAGAYEGGGYAQCEYVWSGTYQACNVLVTFYYDKGGFEKGGTPMSYGVNYCTEYTGDVMSRDAPDTLRVFAFVYQKKAINNYDDAFHNAKDYIDLFCKKKTNSFGTTFCEWSCPDKIYQRNSTNSGGEWYIYLDTRKGSSTSTPLIEDHIGLNVAKSIPDKLHCIGWDLVNKTCLLDTPDNRLLIANAKIEREKLKKEKETAASGKRDPNHDLLAKIQKWGQVGDPPGGIGSSGPCDVISKPAMDIIKTVFWIITIAGILLLILLSAMEFIKVITMSSEDGLKGAFKHTLIRILCAVLLLMLPMFVTWILNMANDNRYQKGEKGEYIIGKTGDPLCKVTK